MQDLDKIDLRIIKVGIEVNGEFKIYDGLSITATGIKFANSNQNECEVKIANLEKVTNDFILTETSPFNLNRTPKILTVDAGRESYGTTRIFSGNIVSASCSQPPDTTITLKCLTGNFQKGKLVGTNQTGIAKLSQIASGVAKDLDVTLDFQATDKQISNYTFSGAALKQVDRLGESGFVNAYIDDGILVIKDYNVPLNGRAKIINIDTGMIGIPEITDQGIKVKFLMDNQTVLGGALIVQSKVYPAASGTYVIYKLGFDIATRNEPFYWIAEAKRI